MMRHPLTWFVLGGLTVIGYHKFVKAVPSNKAS